MKERIKCDDCGGVMNRSMEGIHVYGGGRPEDAPLMRFVCPQCNQIRTVSRDVYQKLRLPDKP